MDQSISAFLEGIPTFILSVVVVFIMLALLIGAIAVLGKMMGSYKKTTEAFIKENPEKPASIQEVAVAEEARQDELELIAVITAVIAASLGTTGDRLQVKSLRKVERKSL